jgi:hypothetical protein
MRNVSFLLRIKTGNFKCLFGFLAAKYIIYKFGWQIWSFFFK